MGLNPYGEDIFTDKVQLIRNAEFRRKFKHAEANKATSWLYAVLAEKAG